MSPMEEALSNSTVLREIFSLLNDEDLERCCHVSQFWRTVADPLVFSHFQIQLGNLVFDRFDADDDDVSFNSDYDESETETDDIIISERARYNREIITTKEMKFEGIIKTLELALLPHKVSISLQIRAKTDDQKKLMENFLSKFGPLVLDVDFHEVNSLSLNMFCMLLLDGLPNLRELNCTDLKFKKDSPDDPNFNPDLPQNKHNHLRKISFRNYATCTFQSFVTFLKMASNLNEIHNLQIELVNALEVAGKGQALKSLATWGDHDFMYSAEYGAIFLAYLQTLARLQPKLTSFHLLENPFPDDDDNFFEMIKPLMFSVLESSSETLQSLRHPWTGWRGYENLPRIEALQKLKIDYLAVDYEEFIFPTNFSLAEIFPNVTAIHISIQLNEVMNRLAESSIIPWGAQIKSLSLYPLSLSTLLKLQKLFPSIEEFKFFGSSNDIGEVLPSLALWTNLKSLTIVITAVSYGVRPLNLDCVFTGLSQEVLDQLTDLSRRGSFTEEEIQRFKDESPMRKFKELKVLRLFFSGAEDVFGLSPSANEFGFKLLPHLKVTLDIDQIKEHMEDVQRRLEPLAHSDNIAIYCDWKR